MASKQRGSKHRKRVSSGGKHRAQRMPSTSHAGSVVVGALATGACASAFWGVSAGTANAACAAIGGLGHLGDNSCSATGQGAWAFSLLPGSTANAVGANNGALAIGLNNTASSTVGTGNIATALGIGNAASSLIAGNGNWNTAVGLNNNATSTGLIGIGGEGDPLVVESSGNNNRNTAFGIGNTAASVLGNGNNNTAAGFFNAASSIGTPGINGTVPLGALGSITGVIDSTGNNNNNTAFGFGNVALTALGNDNNNVAAGLLNQAATVGTPGVDVDAALDAANLASLLGLDIPDGINLDLVEVTGGLDADATGNGNNNFAVGAFNTALTAFGNNNNNIAGGVLNQAVTVGTPGIEAFLQALALRLYPF